MTDTSLETSYSNKKKLHTYRSDLHVMELNDTKFILHLERTKYLAKKCLKANTVIPSQADCFDLLLLPQ